MKKAPRVILLTLFIAMAFFSCSRGKEAPNKTLTESSGQAQVAEAYRKSLLDAKKDIAAVVNGTNITMFDLLGEMNRIRHKYVSPGQKTDEKIDKMIMKESLDRLIYRELAVQEATKQGMQPPPGAVDAELKRFKDALKTEDAYREKLADSGLTEGELKKQVEKDILVGMITEREIFDKVKIDPKAVKNTYDKEKSLYRDPAGRVMTFEEARPLIEEKLMTTLVQKREDEWVEGLKKAAKIEIRLDQSANKIHNMSD